MKKVLYAAAHSGFDLGQVPLGGGAAICRHLVEEWTKTRPFDWQVLGPEILGPSAPRNKDLVRYSELQYAAFCRQFEAALTESILRHDPASTVVLCNDVSEGPDFALLASKGYSLFTIYHVDVVDYFTTIYLKGLVKPESTTAIFRAIGRAGLSGIVPQMLRLVWKKQEDSVRFSKGLIVPSQRMKAVLLREYPYVDQNKIHVLPWGAWDDAVPESDIAQETQKLLQQFPVPEKSFILLMLSRISPEKGQDRLLKALALWEKEPDYPKEGITLLISGEAAYMMGKRYEQAIKRLAGRLKRSRVHFVGYAAPARKKALFELADLYVFPSRHESYGLTLVEAMQAGLPILASPSHGAKELFQSVFGEMIASGPERKIPELLKRSLQSLLKDPSLLGRMGVMASAWARRQNFNETSAVLAGLLLNKSSIA